MTPHKIILSNTLQLVCSLGHPHHITAGTAGCLEGWNSVGPPTPQRDGGSVRFGGWGWGVSGAVILSLHQLQNAPTTYVYVYYLYTHIMNYVLQYTCLIRCLFIYIDYRLYIRRDIKPEVSFL